MMLVWLLVILGPLVFAGIGLVRYVRGPTSSDEVTPHHNGCWDADGVCEHLKDMGGYATTVERYEHNTFMDVRRGDDPQHYITAEVFNAYPSPLVFQLVVEDTHTLVTLTTKTVKVMGLRKSPPIILATTRTGENPAHSVYVYLRIQSTPPIHSSTTTHKFRPVQTEFIFSLGE